MQVACFLESRLAGATVLAAGLALAVGIAPAYAQQPPADVAAKPDAAKPASKPAAKKRQAGVRPIVKCPSIPGKPYFVEFRARTALSYGHSFVIHGRLAPGGGIASYSVAGLHPAGDDPNVYISGHITPVPAETGASEGDLDEKYLSARHCVVLSEAEYRKANAVIRKLQAENKTWHAPTNNCNWFVGEIARGIGMDAPSGGLLYPEVYINSIKSMNSGGSQLPNVPTVQWGLPPS